MSAQNNQRTPFAITSWLGSLAADALVPAFKTPRKCVITSVALLNGANIAASDTNFVVLDLRNGATVLARLDTRAAGEGAVDLNVAKEFGLDGAAVQEGFKDAALVVESEQTLTLNYDETDTGTAVALTNASVQITGYWL